MNNVTCYCCNGGIEVKEVNGKDLCYRCRKDLENAKKAIKKLEGLRLIENIQNKK